MCERFCVEQRQKSSHLTNKKYLFINSQNLFYLIIFNLCFVFSKKQVNLLNAQSNLNQATYDAKNAELKLLQLTGELLNTEF